MANNRGPSSGTPGPRSPEPSKSSSAAEALKRALLEHLKEEHESGNLRYVSEQPKRGVPPERPDRLAMDGVPSMAPSSAIAGRPPIAPKATPTPDQPPSLLGRTGGSSRLSSQITQYNRLRGDASRLAKAGDSDDCGHERKGGEFTSGNTCAGGGTATQDVADAPARPDAEPAKPDHGNISVDSARRYKEACMNIFGRVVKLREVAAIAGYTPEIEKRYPNMPVKITVDKQSNTINVSYDSKRSDKVIPALEVNRTLSKERGKAVLYNGVFFADYPEGAAREEGFGTKFFSDQVDQAIRHGVGEIRCSAEGNFNLSQAKSKKMNGYYTWPRLGYDGPLPSAFIDKNDMILRANFPGREPRDLRLSDLMARTDTRELWLKKGRDVNCTFDLSKGSLSREILSQYRKEKGIDDPQGPDRFRRRGNLTRVIR